MRTLLISKSLVLLTGLLAMQVSQAADFRCFVQADDGRKHVIFAEADSLEMAQHMMQTARVAAKKKGEVGISQIIECKGAEESFTSDAGRQLEQTMPQ